MQGPVEKRCEQCGDIFQCGQYGCWCGRLGLTEQQFDWIAGRFQDCLCRACLEKVRTGVLGPRPSESDRRIV